MCHVPTVSRSDLFLFVDIWYYVQYVGGAV